MNKLKFLFTGGGTGGHVYPNIAIYEALKEKYPEAEFMYVGSKKGSEAGIVPALEQPMKFVTVPTRGLPQNIKSVGAFVALAYILLGAVKSFFILRKFRADIIIGSGGYVSAPVILAAAALKQKVFLHEQNAVPGRLNLICARFAARIAVAFPASAYFFPADKVVCTGYPLRRSILAPKKENVRSKFNIPQSSRVLFIFSGSMGARTINRAAATIIPQLLKEPDLFIIVSTGKAYGREYKAYDSTVRILDQNGYPPEIAGRLLVREYFDPIAEIYAIADLVVSRAGAGAIKEITTMGLPAILIPKIDLPADHQILNAREVEKGGGARVLYEEIGSQEKAGSIFVPPDVFLNTIRELLDGSEPLALMRGRLAGQEKQDSVALIVEAIETVIGKRNGAVEKDLRLFYLQALEDEQNLELPFGATTVGNTFWADLRLENIPSRVLFEIRFPGRDPERAIIRRRRGRLQLNDRDVSGWAELRVDDRIGIDGHTLVFKSYLEKIKSTRLSIDPEPDSAQAPAPGSVLSGLGGFANAIVQAAVFGAGRAMDIFAVAWSVAGLLRRSVGSGAMQAIFLPAFRRLFQRGPRKKAWEAAAAMTHSALLLALLVTATGVLAAPLAVRVLFPGFVAKGIAGATATMTRILFLSLLGATLAAVMAAVLQAFRRYAIVATSAFVLTLGSILAMLALLPQSGIFALGYGMLAGSLLQAAFLLPFLLKTLRRPELEFSYRPLLKLKSMPVRRYLAQWPRLVGSDLLGRSAGVAEKFLASTLARGSLSYLYFAMAIFRLPFALVSRSIAKVVLKDLSSQSALFENEKTKKFFIDGIRITLFLLAPISILIVVLAKPLVALLLQRSHFSALATANTALALQFYAIGLSGWGIHALCSRIMAERLETQTTRRLDLFMALFNIALLVLLIRTRLGFAAVALATSVSYLVFAALHVIILRRRLNRDGNPVRAAEVLNALAKTLSACLLMVIAIIEAGFVFNRIRFESPVIENLILCISLSFMGTAVYFLSSLLFKNSGILFFKKKSGATNGQMPLTLLSPFKFLEVVAVNPDFFKNEYRYKINIYLAHSAWEVRNIGIKLIGLFREKSKGAYLYDLLVARNGNGFMRRNALQALKAINFWNPQFRDLLRRLLKDSYYEVRVAALDILGENITAAEYVELRKTVVHKLRRGNFEEKTACLRLIARRGDRSDLAALRPLYLDSNSPIREELLELFYVFYRRGLLDGPEIKKHIEQVLITSNHLSPEFKVKSIIQRIYREIGQT